MPNKKSAEKRVQIAERNRQRNRAYRSSVKTAIKRAVSLKSANAPEPEVVEALRQAQSLVDRAVLKGILHKNKGARDKARLMQELNRLGETAS